MDLGPEAAWGWLGPSGASLNKQSVSQQQQQPASGHTELQLPPRTQPPTTAVRGPLPLAPAPAQPTACTPVPAVADHTRVHTQTHTHIQTRHPTHALPADSAMCPAPSAPPPHTRPAPRPLPPPPPCAPLSHLCECACVEAADAEHVVLLAVLVQRHHGAVV